MLHRQGQILDGSEVTRPLNPLGEGSNPTSGRIQCNRLDGQGQDTPLQRPRPPERSESIRQRNNENQNDRPQNNYRRHESFGNPWKRASMLWQSVPNGDHANNSSNNYPVKNEKRHYSCREIICICLIPCLLIALLLVAISIITTYFTVTKEMQHRVDQIRRELEEQREQDGGVFMSQEKKQELERKSLELENLRKEFRDLSGLFDLKTSENEKLKDDLTDTIKQLEDKALMLQKTQEEKEVQEHLVSRHKDTESKIKGQAFELREVADQQYSDLDKLHDSRDRKGKLEAFNSKVTSNYQFETADRFGRMERIVDDRADIHGKMCTIVKDSHDHVVKKNEDFTQKTVEDLAKANGDVKEIMSVLDGLSGGHMKAEQTFLSASLADAQSKMSERSTALQNHLKKTLSVTQDVGTAVSRQQKAIDDMVGSFKQHISMDDSLISAFVKSLKDLLDATDKKHDDNFIKAKRLNQANLDEIQDFKHTIETEKKKMENELSEMATQLTAKRDAYSSLFSGLDARLDTIRANVAAAQTEQSEANELVAAAHNTLVQKAHAVDSEKASLSTRALGQLADTYDDVSASLNAMQTGMAGLDDEEKNFVSREQEIERTKYEEMERAFRTRSDEAPKQMQALQEKTREVQKISSESLSAHEMASESHQSQLVRWRDNHAVDFDGVCEQVGEMDTKLRKEIDGAREREKKYFNDDLRKDQPTGKTPGRVNRSYPKDIVEGTPDDVRVRRFRQSRDLTAAMKLKIDDLDSDDEIDENAGDKSGNDSVFSASTAVTADSVSRQNSRENVSMMTNTSKEEEEEAAESEHGYASDAENKAPKSASVSGGDVASGKFAIPGSKLKMPKSYPASTSGSTSNVSARSRSSSRTRTRNVLGSAN